MIKIKELTYINNELTAEVSGLSLPIFVNSVKVQIINGINIFKSKHEVFRVLLSLLHTDDVTIEAPNFTKVYYKADYAYLPTEKEIEDLKLEPFDHQITAMCFGLHDKHNRWLLLDDMGLG